MECGLVPGLVLVACGAMAAVASPAVFAFASTLITRLKALRKPPSDPK